MKYSKIIIVLLISISTYSQKNIGWMKIPLKKKHIKRIEKNREKYLKRYTSSSYGKDRQVYLRIAFVEYLKELRGYESRINLIKDGDKPFPFKLFVDSYAKGKELKKEEKKGLFSGHFFPEDIKISNDTIVEIKDLFSQNRFFNGVGFLPILKDDKSKYSFDNGKDDFKLVFNRKGKDFELNNSYDTDELKDYPHFKLWKLKYMKYAIKFNDSINILKKDKLKAEKNQKLKEEKERKRSLIAQRKKDSINKIERKRLEKIVMCFEDKDDFTNEVTSYTSNKRLVVVESEVRKKRGAEYEAYVFRVKGVRKGNTIMLDVTSDHLTKKPLKYYGIMSIGDLIMFKLKDGNVLNMKMTKTSIPKVNFGKATYKNVLFLSNNQINLLKKSPLSKIRIYYSKGYKDYDVNKNPDAVMKMMKCL